MALQDTITSRQQAARPWLQLWLWLVAVLVFAMVIVGGATRLTDSGLSITEWKPLLGAVPPLSTADWQEAFERYRQIPQYKLINRGMSLDEFKFIYWWEWAHRFLGRFIGLAFLLPMLFFWLTGRIERRLKPRLAGLFLLGGLQGLMGWYMVMSGLVERTDVSQYRLAAHLTLAAVIFAGLIWTALDIGRDRRLASAGVLAAGCLAALVLLQIAAGGFVAGLDAGKAYNTWPLMDGAWVPNGLLIQQPLWRNIFENAMTVQFQHRIIAYLVLFAVLVQAVVCLLRVNAVPSALVMALAAILQVILGIWTLLAHVPLGLALAHQGLAFVLLASVVWHAHALAAGSPLRAA